MGSLSLSLIILLFYDRLLSFILSLVQTPSHGRARRAYFRMDLQKCGPSAGLPALHVARTLLLKADAELPGDVRAAQADGRHAQGWL